MTGCDDPEFADLDAYVTAQIAEAAQAYSSQVNISARLAAIHQAAQDDQTDGTSAPGH
jgi:hypothetical protein